jgi:dynactin 1
MTVLEDIALGQTVRMKDGRTGVVRFVGLTRFAAGDWIGVELEDDSGKNDGSVQGERYFDCAMGHGIFSRAEALIVVAQPAPKPAAAKKVGGRPSSMFTGGTARANAGSDPGLGKRMSLNAPSPSPVPRVSRPSSIARVCSPCSYLV